MNRKVAEPEDSSPCEQGSRTIQLPYFNKFKTLWEYEKLFLSDQIDFVSFLGVRCPICSCEDCYRPMAPYWRYAIELFPEFQKKQIPIARFICRHRRKTFSLLPVQLIPYFQYTLGAVMETLLLGMGCWQMGKKGFHGASMKVDEVDPDNLVTPWLIACWLIAVIQGLRRGHAALRPFYHLDGIHTSGAWEEAAAYFTAFGLRPKIERFSLLMDLVDPYSRKTGQFLFGTPSQYRRSLRR
jgi:hypothetical protein